MNDLVARLLLDDGPARLIAQAGQYDIDEDVVSVVGPMRMLAAGWLSHAGARRFGRSRRQATDRRGRRRGSIPAGTFRADRLTADLSARTLP